MKYRVILGAISEEFSSENAALDHAYRLAQGKAFAEGIDLETIDFGDWAEERMPVCPQGCDGAYWPWVQRI